MRAVRFDRYGDIDVLKVVDVDRPKAGPGELLVRVKAAGINPGEAAIRKGLLHAIWPATFPSGEGSDLAGVVEEVGAGVQGFAAGDEVVGFTNRRASHAEYVRVNASDVVRRPANVHGRWPAPSSWREPPPMPPFARLRRGPATGSWSRRRRGASARSRCSSPGSPARRSSASPAGGTTHGSATTASRRSRTEMGSRNKFGRRGGSVDAFIDAFGGDYVDSAIRLGVRPERIDTIVDFAAAQTHGVKTEGGAAAATAQVLGELVGLVRDGKLDVPIAKTFPLAKVQDAFRELEQRHTRGKIVLVP